MWNGTEVIVDVSEVWLDLMRFDAFDDLLQRLDTEIQRFGIELDVTRFLDLTVTDDRFHESIGLVLKKLFDRNQLDRLVCRSL